MVTLRHWLQVQAGAWENCNRIILQFIISMNHLINLLLFTALLNDSGWKIQLTILNVIIRKKLNPISPATVCLVPN